MTTPALEIRDLEAWYGESHVLHGVDMVVQPGEVVTLLGRNGAGRTSTMRAVMGLTGARKGSVKINGQETIGLPTHQHRAPGRGLLPRRARHFLQPLVRGETCCCHHSSKPARTGMTRRRDLRHVPQPGRAPQQPGHALVWR